METDDRRCDRKSAQTIEEALQVQKVFDKKAALLFLYRMGMTDSLAQDVLILRYGRRVGFRRLIPRAN
jgi:hypothetical protein